VLRLEATFRKKAYGNPHCSIHYVKAVEETGSISMSNGFSGLEVVCWPLVPKFASSNPAEAVGFFRVKNPQHTFLGGEVKAILSHVADLRHVKES
jgi:hypothetical protein